MLENVNLSQSLEKKKFEKMLPKLELRLRTLQREAFDAGVPVVLAFEAWYGAGKGDSINKLVEVLDPRGFRVYPTMAPTKEEREHPFLWRFWRKLPAKGQMAIFDRTWYGRVLVERFYKMIAKKQWKRAYSEINDFERMLADDGCVLLKFWLHISKKEQKKRLKKFEKDPLLHWRITKEWWEQNKKYEKYDKIVEDMLEKTNTNVAPWTIVEANDKHYAFAKIYQAVSDAIEKKLSEIKQKAKDAKKTAAEQQKEVESAKHKERKTETVTASSGVLSKLNLKLALSDKEYDAELPKWQTRLRELQQEIRRKDRAVVIVYEGMDAAGKGGNIKRLTGGLDPRGFTVVPIAAPTAEEKAHHYLWRFWTRLPQTDHITIYDRSWYGRVLVERIEGFCSEEEWRRAFQEINEFERQLTDWGAILVKFWIHIDKKEQLRRFKERADSPLKNWKITQEDWRNREKLPQYERGANDMLEYTGTTYAPWTVIEGNDKRWARIKALRTVVKAIENNI